MKFLALFIIFFQSLFSDESFITQAEYAQQLYFQPRGIGCDQCHGVKGEGKLIATYEHKGEKLEFRPPSIKDLPFDKFYEAMNKRVNGMPRYFLTDGEIRTLYLYLHPKRLKKKI
jgi:hypothetical protein